MNIFTKYISNDIEMLDTIGFGIAMRNASKYVKSRSRKIINTIGNNGIAVGVEKYIKLV